MNDSAITVDQPTAPTASRSFRVRFQPRFALSSAELSSLELVGSGEVELAGDLVILNGRRRRPLWFSAPASVTFQRGDIVNVVRKGKQLAFQAESPEFISKTIRLWAPDEAAAQALANALPGRQTEAFAKVFAEQRAFQGRLEATGTKAWITPWLVAANVAVFALVASDGAGILQPNVDVLIKWGSNFGPYTMNGQWWRLFSAMFLHLGLLHLALNMWALWSGGRLIERLYGNFRYLLLYLLSGIGASLASLFWNPLVDSLGASGAIFGIYGGLLAFFSRQREGVPMSIVQSQRASATSFIAYSLFFGLTHAGIDNAAHLGGLTVGFAIGWLLAPPLDLDAREKQGSKSIPIALAAALALLASLAYPSLHPTQSVRADQRFMLDLPSVESVDKATGSLYRALAAQLKEHQLTDAQFVARLERDVIPPYEGLLEKIRSERVSANSKLADQYGYVSKYLELRTEAYHLVHDGLANNDQRLMDQARAKFQEQQELVNSRKKSSKAK